ncbi:MAG: ATP-binding protein [Clostridiales bacterium]|nr:ATP-binding protein [Clostridiales bacterium]
MNNEFAMNKHTIVLIGHYGSGKSELAINLALESAKTNSTILVDIDIVNPYFRSSDIENELKEQGIDMIKPNFAGTGVESLSLPADIYSVFIDSHETVIFDVGGDMTGAIALGQYKRYFDMLDNLEVLFVINTKRLSTSTVEDNISFIQRIEAASRLKITGLVNNTNLSNETTVYTLLEGFDVVKAVSQEVNIPIVYTVGEPKILNDFLQNDSLEQNFVGTPYPINRYMERDWDRFLEKHQRPKEK